MHGTRGLFDVREVHLPLAHQSARDTVLLSTSQVFEVKRVLASVQLAAVHLFGGVEEQVSVQAATHAGPQGDQISVVEGELSGSKVQELMHTIQEEQKDRKLVKKG